MNTCRAPHLEMSPKCFTMATIVLFSASEPADCTLVVCDSEWVSAALNSAFLISTFCCYMAGAMWNCCHLGASSLCTIQPCVIGRSWHKYHFCHDKTFVMTNMCLSWQTHACHVKTCLLLRQKYACHDRTFCHDKYLLQQTFCRNKHTFVMTKVCLSQKNFCVVTKLCFC